MTAKQNQNASNNKRSKTINNDDDSPSWSDLLPEILVLIMLRLEVVDFLAFSGVCPSWRTVALSNWDMFMSSKLPMAILISTQVARRKVCRLEDCEGRRFRTILPRSSGRTCVGIVSGYLILFGTKTHDFRLVNPITRRELYFPRCPFLVVRGPEPEPFRGTIVFSPTMLKDVFIISTIFSRTVFFSLSGKQASWSCVSSDFPICDIIYFKEKIYTLDKGIRLCEVRLSPQPTLTPLNMKNSLALPIIFPHFATFGEKLFVMGYPTQGLYPVKVDFDEMKWVTNEIEFWDEPQMRYPRRGRFYCPVNNKAMTYLYSPYKCWNVHILHE